MPTIRSGDADIFFEIIGSGEPLLMIMGLGADSRMWMLQTPAFSARYTCVALDNRGVGRSSAPEGSYTTEQMAGDALAVMDAAGVERAHVLGISLGGAIAQQVALKAPERVRSLTLAATWCARNPYTDRMAEIGRHVAGLGDRVLIRSALLWTFSSATIIGNPALLDQVEQVATDYHPSPAAFLRQLDAVVAHDTVAALGSLSVPTLVMIARRDIMVPPELGHQVAAAIPGAEAVELDGGHAFNMESVAEFNTTVMDFLERH